MPGDELLLKIPATQGPFRFAGDSLGACKRECKHESETDLGLFHARSRLIIGSPVFDEDTNELKMVPVQS